MHTERARGHRLVATCVFASVALLIAACSSEVPGPTAVSSLSTSSSAPAASTTSPSATTPPTTSSGTPTPSPATSAAAPASDDRGPLPTSIAAVGPGELTGFRVTHDGHTTLDAQSSGLARYETSATCEVPGQPCYDAPRLDRVARIDLGAAPTVPGKDTTFITGHSNRFQPDDPTKGIFSHLQDARTGDTLVLTTTAGTFVYGVTKTLTVPFDRLTSTDDVVRVQPDTVVAISCYIPPDRGPYQGNYVVIATLRASAPA